MGIRAAGDHGEIALDQPGRQRLRIGDDGLAIDLEFRGERFLEGRRLARDLVHQRPALGAREHGRIDLLRQIRIVGQDHAAAAAAQGLVGRGRGYMGIRHRARMHARRHQPGEMRHIHHERGADAVGDLAETGEIEEARIGRPTGDDELRPVLVGEFSDPVVVDQVVVLAHAVLDRVEPFAGERRRRAVGEMTAGRQRQAEDRVAGFEQRHHDGRVRLRPRMGLDIGEAAAEQLLGPLDRQTLGNIDMIAAGIVAAGRIAFGIFVGEHRTLGLQHGAGDDILGSDQFDLLLLAAQFGPDAVV